jgi:nitric oxide reductase NorE protein
MVSLNKMCDVCHHRTVVIRMERTIEPESSNNLYYPPGGILIWIIIFLEILTFAMALVVLNVYRGSEPEVFAEGQALLNRSIGLSNTLILLTSGFFMALGVHALRENDHKKSARMIALTILFGLAFLILKGVEYSEKIEHGLGIDESSFFMFYWLLTGFHFVHVLVGAVLLLFMYFKVKNGFYNAENMLDVESSAAFWHMCDLIWLFLFPVIYLLH